MMCHPGAWFDKLTNLVKIPACTEQGRSKHAEGTFLRHSEARRDEESS